MTGEDQAPFMRGALPFSAALSLGGRAAYAHTATHDDDSKEVPVSGGGRVAKSRAAAPFAWAPVPGTERPPALGFPEDRSCPSLLYRRPRRLPWAPLEDELEDCAMGCLPWRGFYSFCPGDDEERAGGHSHTGGEKFRTGLVLSSSYLTPLSRKQVPNGCFVICGERGQCSLCFDVCRSCSPFSFSVSIPASWC